MFGIFCETEEQRSVFWFVETDMKPRAILIYDGECRFCEASQKLLRRFVGWKLRALPLQNPEALTLHAELTTEKAQSRLHLVVKTPSGDQLFGGMEAVAQTVALRPIGKIALLYYVPGLRRVLDFAYGWIARHRYQIFGRVVGGCENGACSIAEHQSEKGDE